MHRAQSPFRERQLQNSAIAEDPVVTTGLTLPVSLWCYALPAGAAEEAERVRATGVQVAPTAPGRNKATPDAAAIHSKGKRGQAHRYLLQRDPSSVQGKSWLAKNKGWPLKWKPTFFFPQHIMQERWECEFYIDKGDMAQEFFRKSTCGVLRLENVSTLPFFREFKFVS